MDLSKVLPKNQIFDSQLYRFAYAHDASMYRLVPKVVVRPFNEKEVKLLFAYCHESRTPVTFRASGTSLSGQSVTEGILAESIQHWESAKVLDNGAKIQLQPGVTGARANIFLKSYNRKIGPDPASINVARMGGIISNNSSGMVCGVKNNAYHTLDSIRFILPNGNVYDTSIKNHYENFISSGSDLSNGLLQCKHEIESSKLLKDKIRSKYRIKNTLGYSLNAFIDFDHPLDIFSHLLVGSEGTLAFLSEVTLKTVPDPPYKTTGLALFKSVDTAMQTLPIFINEGADAVELLDDASLKTARYLKNPPFDYKTIQSDMAGLLFEFQEYDNTALMNIEEKIGNWLKKEGCTHVFGPTKDEQTRVQLWKLRKGLYPTVGALRKKGTSVITEDLCYQYKDLPEVVKELRIICQNWKYNDAVIFGHAKDGNLHFVASLDLNSSDGIDRFDGLIRDIVDLTVNKFDGALKAEHGTGRNMAPFVEYAWGSELYKIMWKVKQLVDPKGILNPDVLLSKDKKLHIKNLKPIPIVDDSIDLCIECGFCESVCPSAGFTLTPRQRIAVAREIEIHKNTKNIDHNNLMKDMQFHSVETCAGDGLCEITCPVNINTGHFVKTLRKKSHSKITEYFALWTQRNFQLVQSILRILLRIFQWASFLLGTQRIHKLSGFLNKITNHSIPVWNANLVPAKRLSKSQDYTEKVEYIIFPSCVNRILGANIQGESLTKILDELSKQSHIRVLIPKVNDKMCCGLVFESKGFEKAERAISGKTVHMLYNLSNSGKIPIVVDASPCTAHFIESGQCVENSTSEYWKKLKFIDIIQFLDIIVEKSKHQKLKRDIILHPTCSTQRMESVDLMKSLAEKCTSGNIILPGNSGCCGFAGDRGLRIPELPRNASKQEIKELNSVHYEIKGYSSSRTCEIGMMTSSNRIYESILFLVRDYLNSHIVS